MSNRPPAAQPPFVTSSPSRVPGELVSALMDGQLRGPLLAQTVRELTRDPQALKRWDDYHLIGEAMRSPQAQGASLVPRAPDFLSRLQRRLAEEKPTPSAAPGLTQAAPLPAIPRALTRGEPAATKRVRLWQGVSAFASAAALAAVAWHLLLPLADGPQWAQSAPQQLPPAVQAQASARATGLPPGFEVVVDSPKGLMLRDARMQELLAAHKQVAGNSALPVPAVFLRNATFEAGADARR